MAGKCTKLVVQAAALILQENSELFDKQVLDLNYLPRNVDVLGYIYYLKDNGPYHTKFEELYQTVANEVVNIWKRTDIPILANGHKQGDKHIKKRLDNVLIAYKKVKRNVRAKKSNAGDMEF